MLAAVFAWGRRGLVLAIVAAVIVAAAALATPSVRHDVFGHNSKSTTSGRGTLVRRGAHIAVHHPLAGVGIGGFKHAYAELAGLKGKEPNAAASHTTPVTVAAEGGIVGFALYVWLLVAALLLAFRRFARDLAGPRRAHLRPGNRCRRRTQPLLQRVLRGPDRLGRHRPGRRACRDGGRSPRSRRRSTGR